MTPEISYLVYGGIFFAILGTITVIAVKYAHTPEPLTEKDIQKDKEFAELREALEKRDVDYKKRCNDWDEVTRGKYAEVTYLPASGKSYAYGKTIFRLEDGRAFVLRGHWSVDFPRGTEVTVLGNPFSEYKIKKTESPD